nr:hypothetical protein [Tanacetum cinerariifolium]
MLSMAYASHRMDIAWQP